MTTVNTDSVTRQMFRRILRLRRRWDLVSLLLGLGFFSFSIVCLRESVIIRRTAASAARRQLKVMLYSFPAPLRLTTQKV
jgi:hypothetical protein